MLIIWIKSNFKIIFVNKIILKSTIYFDGEECVDAETGKTIPGADLGQTYKKMSDAIKKYFKIK